MVKNIRNYQALHIPDMQTVYLTDSIIKTHGTSNCALTT